jgi:hypothetical protein
MNYDKTKNKIYLKMQDDTGTSITWKVQSMVFLKPDRPKAYEMFPIESFDSINSIRNLLRTQIASMT